MEDKMEDYITGHIDPEEPELHELDRLTNLKVMHPRMLSGHLQGKILRMICRMISPMNVLEIGTYTGYGTICLAQGLKEGGHVHSIEINDELADIPSQFIRRMNLENKITLHIGNALDIIPRLDILFDLIFIDGEKSEYLSYYQLVIDKINKGGFILADNILWSGKVLEQEPSNDHFTRGIKQFNDFVKQDDRVEKVILPIRDGLMILRKK